MTQTPEGRLQTLGIDLPAAASPGFDYVPLTVDGNTLYLSAQLAKIGGQVRTRGRVGDEVSFEQAQDVMRHCALQGIAWIREELGSLDRVRRVLRVNAYVCCVPGFDRMSEIADVASGLLIDVFGESGKHARTVLGVVELPRNVPCMFDATLALLAEPLRPPR